MADDGREASAASRKRSSPCSDDEMEDAPRAVSAPETASAPAQQIETAKAPPPPPPPAPKLLPLRQPHKLRQLQEQYDRRLEEAEQQKQTSKPESDETVARNGLRRALVLALDHVGFDSATDDALESFLLKTESYFQSLAEDVARFALAGRRSQPIPLDFEATLPRFNLGTGGLRPHLKPPIPRSKRVPQQAENENTNTSTTTTTERTPWDGGDLPLLIAALSGRPEKDAKSYIPAGFPDFPSIHTYRHTPVDVDKVTVIGCGLRYEDGTMLPPLPDEEGGGANANVHDHAHVNADDGAASDPKRIREAAAVEAKQAEEALRGLMRASKVNKLREVRAAADRNKLNKQRYTLWETAMRELIVGSKSPTPAAAAAAAAEGSTKKNAAAAAALREEIADQSMMVNAEKAFYRKEIPRKSRRLV